MRRGRYTDSGIGISPYRQSIIHDERIPDFYDVGSPDICAVGTPIGLFPCGERGIFEIPMHEVIRFENGYDLLIRYIFERIVARLPLPVVFRRISVIFALVFDDARIGKYRFVDGIIVLRLRISRAFGALGRCAFAAPPEARRQHDNCQQYTNYFFHCYASFFPHRR